MIAGVMRGAGARRGLEEGRARRNRAGRGVRKAHGLLRLLGVPRGALYLISYTLDSSGSPGAPLAEGAIVVISHVSRPTRGHARAGWWR